MSQGISLRKGPRISLRVKTFIALLLVGVPPMFIALLLAYLSGTGIHEYYTGTRFQSFAQWISREMKASIVSEIAEAKTLALTPTVLQAVSDANRTYEGKEQEAIVRQLEVLDEEWTSASKVSESMRSYLSNNVSRYLQSILKHRSDKYAEIIVTDEYGGLVGATGKTSDFYQGDEDWWKTSFHAGNGRDLVEGVGLDESTQVRSLTIAVPVRDPESNTVMGVLKMVVRADYLFRSVDLFRIDNTGFAGLTTSDGVLLATSAPSKPARVIENFWRPIVELTNGWKKAHDEKGEEHVIGFAGVDLGDINAEVRLTGSKWFVFFYQSISEGYARISALAWKVFSLGFVLVLGLSALGFYATNRIVMPIRLLREEAQYIAQGDLGRQVEVHTNDEIELLAEEINIMSAKLKETHANLEQRIEERTTELSEANKKLEAQREVLLKVNKQLMKASTLKSQFLADICDGLTNPVMNIIRLAEVVSKQPLSLDASAKEYLGDILSNAKHLHQLINEVFTLAKATSGKIELNLTEFDVGEVLREVHETVRALASERNIRFEFSIDPGVGQITADMSLFRHIIFNLYTNAIKYNRINEKITVSATRVDDSLEIAVEDRGIGIRAEDQERIFHEFERVEDAQEPYFEGTGMGLALAQRFVEMHGGKIWVESEYGKGSRFVFRIPSSPRTV
ncbi:MAG: hypothetical protein Kow0099_00610 [Candidatus Abyssubacteria bacterium]